MGAFTPDLPISALFSISQLNEVVREWSILQFRLDHLPKSIRLLNSWFILSFFFDFFLLLDVLELDFSIMEGNVDYFGLFKVESQTLLQLDSFTRSFLRRNSPCI